LAFVVKNGSKAWARVSSSIPAPVSVIASITCGPRLERQPFVPQTLVIQFHIGGFDGDMTACRHGIARVEHEIDDYLLDLIRIGLDETKSCSKERIGVDVIANQPRQHVQQTGDAFVDVDDRWIEELFAAEGEQLARQRSAAVSGADESPELRVSWTRQPRTARQSCRYSR
jgi:ribosomal protein S9